MHEGVGLLDLGAVERDPRAEDIAGREIERLEEQVLQMAVLFAPLAPAAEMDAEQRKSSAIASTRWRARGKPENDLFQWFSVTLGSALATGTTSRNRVERIARPDPLDGDEVLVDAAAHRSVSSASHRRRCLRPTCSRSATISS